MYTSVIALTVQERMQGTLINLTLPQEDMKYYMATEYGAMCGPFNPRQVSIPQDISILYANDFISQGNSLYHENDVVHQKTQGSFTAVPVASEFRPFTAASPTSFLWECMSGDDSRPYPNYEFACFAKAGMSYRNRSYDYVHILNADPYAPSYIRIRGRMERYKPSDSSYTITKTTTKYRSFGGSTVRYDYERQNRTVDVRSSISKWGDLLEDPSQIMNLWNKGTSSTTTSGTFDRSYYHNGKPSLNVSPQAFKTWIDSLIESQGEGMLSSLKRVHYGDLAARALQHLNANSTNMLAFLKDIRRPQELIPKLKNLRNIKTYADNYLTLEYGILPTISDLKEIFGAFKAQKAYYDRNGFSTYNAEHTDSIDVGDRSASIEQRIKVAIGSTESELAALLSRIDSAGFSPTLSNLWDLVPYSFAIDWFVDIGDFLESIDTRMRFARYDIRYATSSQKDVISISVPPPSIFVGDLSMVRYSRWTTDRCPVPPLFSYNAPTASDHWLEASALFIQRRK